MARFLRTAALAAALATLVASAVPTAPAQPKDGKTEFVGAIEIFKDRAGEFRWRVKDLEGKVVAQPPKGYDTREECLNALNFVKTTLVKGKVTDVKGDAEPKKK